MSAFIYLFLAFALIIAGAVLWSMYGPNAMKKAAALKQAADTVKADLGNL
jgi:hypothetical protein